jgi:phosphoadenosine phosphosulfate reductase
MWCDSGYHDHHTYSHAARLINDLNLNINVYTHLRSKGFIDATLGLPSINDPRQEEFTELVKLEPFRRALAEHSQKYGTRTFA